MTTDERFIRLHPRHHRFVQVPDPWHVSVLAKNPVIKIAIDEGRLIQRDGADAIHGGDVYGVWFSMDVLGNLLQEWGFDAPPVYQ